MAITATAVGLSNENGQARASSVSRGGARTYTRHIIMETDDQSVGPKAVREAVPVSIGQAYSANLTGEDGASDDSSFVQSISVTEVSEDGRQWLATVEYGPYDAEINPINPLDAQPRISWSWAQFQKPVFKDKDDELVVNKAGDFFVPAIEIDDPRPVLVLVRNESSFNPSLVDEYSNAINDDTWFGIGPRKWKVSSISANRVFNPEIPGASHYYWEVTYEFHLNPEEWTIRPRNDGMRELYEDGGETKKRFITDSHGEKVDEPWPLKEDGTKKPAGEAADFLEFHVYPEKDFGVFNFDGFFSTLTGG